MTQVLYFFLLVVQYQAQASSPYCQNVISNRVQENAFPRQIQAKLELFVAETYGQSRLSVTMKMETFLPSNDMVPNMKIQIVLEPPASQ
jgi:hypothetical protein